MAEIKQKGSTSEVNLENLAKDEPIIQEVKRLAKLSLTDKELKEINDMFEGSSKRIQFILSNEKEYGKIQNVCQKIQNYLKAPLKIEAGITTAKMLAIGLATGEKISKECKLQWLPLESLQVLFYEAKLPFSESCIAI